MITPQDLTAKEQSKVLSPEEKQALTELELFIDKSLKNSYIRGRASVYDFWYAREECPIYCALKDVRKKIIRELMFDKYHEKGWRIHLIEGEDDGPNRPGIDYWEFRVFYQ